MQRAELDDRVGVHAGEPAGGRIVDQALDGGDSTLATDFTRDAGDARGGGLAIAGHSADARAGVKPASLRTDTFDASFDFGGLDDPSAAVAASDLDSESWTFAYASVLPAAFVLPVSVVRTRDGRTRAPPRA